MTLLTKIQTLLSTWFPNKTQDKANFDEWMSFLKYENGTFSASKTLWQPTLNGETEANYKWSYSESNGEAVGKGFVFKNGFKNVHRWELSFDFKHDNIQYTGICFLCDLASGYKGDGGNAKALTTWEGSWSGGDAYATYRSGAVGYFDVKVTKIDSTHLRLQSTSLNRDTTVEISWLATATDLSFGARHNTGSSSYGPCRIKNVKVKQVLL